MNQFEIKVKSKKINYQNNSDPTPSHKILPPAQPLSQLSVQPLINGQIRTITLNLSRPDHHPPPPPEHRTEALPLPLLLTSQNPGLPLPLGHDAGGQPPRLPGRLLGRAPGQAHLPTPRARPRPGLLAVHTVRWLGLPQELRVEVRELRRSEQRHFGRENAVEFSGRVDPHGLARREGRMDRMKFQKFARNLKLALPTASQSKCFVNRYGSFLLIWFGSILMVQFETV